MRAQQEAFFKAMTSGFPWCLFGPIQGRQRRQEELTDAGVRGPLVFP
jgi:hypothetical protein